MNGFEIAQTIGALAAGLGIFHYSRSKGLSLSKSIFFAFGAFVLFHIGGAIAIYFMSK
jgi:hypothetical protein